MKLNKLSALLAASTLLASSAAMSWESEDGQHSTSANVGIASDYMWRGYSNTDNEMQIFGGFDYSHASGFYLGTWASNVDFASSGKTPNQTVQTEFDIYAGYGADIGDTGFAYDVSVLRYIYQGTDASWNEFAGSISYDNYSFLVAYTNNIYGANEDAIYYNLSASYELPADFSLDLGLGFYDIDEAAAGDDDIDIDYYIGLNKSLIGFDWTLAYTGMNDAGRDYNSDSLADSRFVLSLSKSM